MKRVPIACISAALGLSVALTGCAGGKNPQNPQKPVDESKASAPGVYPIVKEKQTFKIFLAPDAFIEDFNTNEFTKWYEEKTNIHVEWEIVPTTAAKEKLQVKLASTDLPDIFFNSSMTGNQMSLYGSQGVFQPLNSYIDKYGPNIKKMFEEVPLAKNMCYTPDGKIYGLPRVVDSINESMPKRMWINQTWLDKLKLSMPQTTDEFYEVLKAFKTKDPNGNGKADEVPLAGADGEKNANNEIESFLMQSFLFYNRANHLAMNGDKVVLTADKPEYKDGLKYLRKLYSEGLIDKESFIQDRKALTGIVENEAQNRLGAVTAFYWGHFSIENGPSGRDKEYVAVPPLKGPSGLRQGFERGAQILGQRFVVTKNCKNPEAAVRWIDWFFNTDQMMAEGYLPSLGKEGVGYKKATAGQKGVDGKDALYEILISPGTKNNVNWSQNYATYESAKFVNGMVASDKTRKEVFGTKETTEKYKPYSVNKAVPNLFYSEDQVARASDLSTSVKKVADTFMVKFITGSADIDKDWDAYLKELKNAGADEFVKLTQEAYDANYKNAKK